MNKYQYATMVKSQLVSWHKDFGSRMAKGEPPNLSDLAMIEWLKWQEEGRCNVLLEELPNKL